MLPIIAIALAALAGCVYNRKQDEPKPAEPAKPEEPGTGKACASWDPGMLREIAEMEGRASLVKLFCGDKKSTAPDGTVEESARGSVYGSMAESYEYSENEEGENCVTAKMTWAAVECEDGRVFENKKP